MEKENLKNIIESILFALSDGVELKQLLETIEGTTPKEIKEVIKELKNDYDYNLRGIKLVEAEGVYQLTTRDEYFSYVKKVLTHYQNSVLSQAALETLAIVAYRQPVTRLDIELIRGVKSTSSLDLLIDRGLVTQAGKQEDIIGKPMGFKTTTEFLKLAGVSSLRELPSFEEFIKDIEIEGQQRMELEFEEITEINEEEEITKE